LISTTVLFLCCAPSPTFTDSIPLLHTYVSKKTFSKEIHPKKKTHLTMPELISAPENMDKGMHLDQKISEHLGAKEDPAHPDNANDNHTLSDGTKPETGLAAILDPNFIPTLDEGVPTIRWIQSFVVLSAIIAGGIAVGWLGDLEIFQTKVQLAVITGSIVVAFFFTGAAYIDYWELVVKYWWFSIPMSAAAGLAYVIMEETGKGLEEVD